MQAKGALSCWWWVMGVAATALLSGCATTGSRGDCSAGDRDINGKPCWLSVTPQRGVVVSGAEHIHPEQTEGVLLDQAIAQLAKLKGATVRSATQVQHEVSERNGHVDKRAATSTVSEVKVDTDSQLIKTEILDRFVDASTRKYYLWVIPAR